jgi:murein DD-endopeptidase MepM/ murein hydrolase activator NlpD/SH3-like domain-containing protein
MHRWLRERGRLRAPIRVLGPTLAVWMLTACNPWADDRPVTHQRYSESLADSGLDRTALGQAWLAAAETALESPDRPELPLAMRGVWLAHEASALGIAFAAVAGQSLEIELDFTPLAGSTADSRVYVDLYRVDRRGARTEYDPLTLEIADDVHMLASMSQNGEYVLRLQPELLVGVEYRLALELTAALPFPVAGYRLSDAQSGFGDARDGGARRHEGVDIFAPRTTPVVAVDDGRAVPRRNRLGGNVVWLRTEDRSYYYAHLERAALDAPRMVEAGEIVGYVGNSGNAASTPTHLHFGLYRRRKGALDPLPYLRANVFEQPAVYSLLSPRFVRTTASELNLRAGPSRRARALGLLPKGTAAWVDAVSGEWSRVQLPNKMRGWIHADYQTSLDVAGDEWRTAEAALLMLAAQDETNPLAVIAAGVTVETLAESSGIKLVRVKDDHGLTGWYRPLRDVSVRTATAGCTICRARADD